MDRCFALWSAPLGAQQFPRLQEENLAGQQVVLPDAAAGKIAVLVLGFSRASQNSTGAWVKHLRDDFGNNRGFVLYQLPVLEEAPRPHPRHDYFRNEERCAREPSAPTLCPVMHNEADLKTLVRYKEADDAYLVVLDRTGKITYQTHGGPDACRLCRPAHAVTKAAEVKVARPSHVRWRYSPQPVGYNLRFHPESPAFCPGGLAVDPPPRCRSSRVRAAATRHCCHSAR